MKKVLLISAAVLALALSLASGFYLLYFVPRQVEQAEQERAAAYRDSLLAEVQADIDSLTVMLDTLKELDRFVDSVWGDLPRDGWYMEKKTEIAAQRLHLVSALQARRLERAAMVGE